jgi:hypothetical protein
LVGIAPEAFGTTAAAVPRTRHDLIFRKQQQFGQLELVNLFAIPSATGNPIVENDFDPVGFPAIGGCHFHLGEFQELACSKPNAFSDGASDSFPGLLGFLRWGRRWHIPGCRNIGFHTDLEHVGVKRV